MSGNAFQGKAFRKKYIFVGSLSIAGARLAIVEYGFMDSRNSL